MRRTRCARARDVDNEPRLLANGTACCALGTTLCPACGTHYASIYNAERRAAEACAPPDPYAHGLTQLRAAPATPEQTFEQR